MKRWGWGSWHSRGPDESQPLHLVPPPSPPSVAVFMVTDGKKVSTQEA
jgi:hypothetical protein